MADHDTHDHTGVPGVGSSTTVATDTIWDAVGDLAVGTGANTAAKLSVGSNAGYALVTRGTGVQPWWASISGGALTVADEGSPLSTAATTLDFVGAGVTASGSGATKTITIAGGGGSSGYDLDTYSIDATYGDDFTAGSLGGSWTRRNYVSGDETYQLGKNGTYLRIAKAGQSAGDGYFRTAPAGDWTFAMAFVPRHFGNNGCAWGIGVVDTNGTGVATVAAYSAPVAPLLVQVTTYSTYGGSYTQPGGSGAAPNITIFTSGQLLDCKMWVYLRKSGTNYYTAYSLDGEAWSDESAALAWAGTVDRIAMMDAPLGTISSGTGTGSFVDVDWFNKIA